MRPWADSRGRGGGGGAYIRNFTVYYDRLFLHEFICNLQFVKLFAKHVCLVNKASTAIDLETPVLTVYCTQHSV